MVQITLTTERLTKNPHTKTTYISNSKESEVIDETQYKNIINSASFFRRLGGSVSQVRAYTCNGYCVVRDVATSPDKSSKTIRDFSFKWVE